jgi:uncharacterized protein involved in exopolysaccharide biosynthesis
MDTRVYPAPPPTHERDEIRIKELIELLWQWRWRVAAFVIGCTVAVGGVSFLVTKQYDAEVIISPVATTPSERGMSGTSGALGSLGGLAALAGMSLGTDSKKAESIATLQSQALTAQYIRDNNLLPILYEDKWDAAHGKWNVTSPKKIPTLWKAVQFFKDVRTISTDAKTGLVSMTIRWNDPVLAAKWANDLVKLTNDYERGKAIAESDRNIAYLTQQAASTDVVGIKQAIYNLLQSEISKSMIAKGTNEYAFKIIDPATVSEKAAFPKKPMWVLAAFFASFFLAVFYAFCRVAWQKG